MGRKSPITAWSVAFVMLIISMFPQLAFANTPYLIDNTESFLSKIDKSYGQMIDIAALLHDYDAKLITAVIVVESEGKTSAVSNRGARGLMQLMPGTARAMGAVDPKDPFQNILAGTKYLKELEGPYGFKSPQQALVAYNMGPSRAKRWLSQYDADEYVYVQKVMYVYGVLAQMELDDARVSGEVSSRVAALSSFGDNHSMMTKPVNLSLAGLPLALPSARRGDVVADN